MRAFRILRKPSENDRRARAAGISTTSRTVGVTVRLPRRGGVSAINSFLCRSHREICVENGLEASRSRPVSAEMQDDRQGDPVSTSFAFRRKSHRFGHEVRAIFQLADG